MDLTFLEYHAARPFENDQPSGVDSSQEEHVWMSGRRGLTRQVIHRSSAALLAIFTLCHLNHQHDKPVVRCGDQ